MLKNHFSYLNHDNNNPKIVFRHISVQRKAVQVL